MRGKVYIGIAGWSYPEWKGIVYTQPKIDPLEYVSQFIDCLEINNTFYRPPSEKNTASWLQRTATRKDFFFTAKLHRDFTHEGKLDTEMVEQFHIGFHPLLKAGRLKHLLAQFRYDFYDCAKNRKHLAEIAKNFSETFSLAVEVRHSSWESPDALDFLQDLGVAVCNLDYPTTYNSFNMQHCIVGRDGYFRMHGRNVEKWFDRQASRNETYDYYYSAGELAQIKTRIDRLAEAFETLTVITNNHYRGAELANAIELKALLTGHKQLIPEGLLKAYPNLTSIALKSGNRPVK